MARGAKAASSALSSLSLRFFSQEMEASYLRSRASALVRRARHLALLYSLASGSLLAFLLLQDEAEPLTDVARWSTLVHLASEAAIFLSNNLFLLGLCLCSRRWNHVLLEVWLIFFMTLNMAVITFCAPTRLVKLQGYSLSEAFDSAYDSDSSLLLTLNGFVTAAHLGLPVRWYVMAPLELAAVALYLLNVAVVGSEEPLDRLFFNCISLVCLVAASALSKRSAETDERLLFMGMISEKTLRCQAEFRLEQTGPLSRSSEDECSSEVTDRSGAIFESFLGEVTREQLELMAAKGESEHWRIPSEEVRLLGEGHLLGQGGFGAVQRAAFCGMLVAVKRPRLDKVGAGDLCNELRVLRHLRHPHILAAHGAVVLPKEGQVLLVLELVQGRSLTTFLQPSDPTMTPSGLQRYQVMVAVSGALLYMHSRTPQIIHGDLKGDNVMVELHGGRAVPKLLDFGLSRVVNSHVRALGGTLAWVAPEVMGSAKAPVHCSADIYSFGLLLFYAATSKPPMEDVSRGAFLRALRRQKLPQPLWPEGNPFAPGLQALVASCLEVQPRRRPGAAGLHRHLLGLSKQLRLPSEAYLQEVQELALLLEAGQPPACQAAPSPGSRTQTPLDPLPEEAQAEPGSLSHLAAISSEHCPGCTSDRPPPGPIRSVAL